ncbi:hypothetical protein Tco_0319808 [Tanacetum coccineum]
MKIVVEKTPWLEQPLQVTLCEMLRTFLNSSSVGSRLHQMIIKTKATDAKSGSIDGRICSFQLLVVALVELDNSGGGVKECNECADIVENTGDDSLITKKGNTGTTLEQTLYQYQLVHSALYPHHRIADL